MRKLGHVPPLDALRGIAIALVLGGHAGYAIPGGALGVDLFFVLSGFLITSLLLNEWHERGQVNLLAFYRRRALRLLPALAALLGAYCLAVGFLTLTGRRPVQDLGDALLGSLFGLAYATNVAHLAGPLPVGEFAHLWSLAEEEQFYLLWPPILLLVLSFRLSPRRLIIALAVLAAASATEQATLWLGGASINRIWLGPDTHAYPLLLGCLAGIAFTNGKIRRVPGWLMAIACITSVWTLAFGVVQYPFFTLAATVLVLGCVLEQGSPIVRLLDQWPLRALGIISYGLYLWQGVVLQTGFGVFPERSGLIALPAIGVAIACAVLSYYLVERPFLRRKRRFRMERSPLESRRPEVSETKLAEAAV